MIRNMIICLLLLIGVLTQSLAQTDSSTGQSINQPIIDRISGCTDVGNITTNCARAHQSIITILGSGFMPTDASIKDYSILLIQPDSRLSYRLTSINDTCITVAYQLYYGQFMNADPITVTIIYQSNDFVSAVGLSYEPVQPLSLSRIDGCGVVSPDGLSASECNYLNPIILVGSGFNAIAADSYRIAFGSSIMSFVARDGMVVLNDSAISLQLSSISMLLPLEAYTSSVPLQISAYSWNLTTFYIRYSSIPASQVTQISPLNNQGCVASEVDGKTRLSGCYAGRSIVRFTGSYIWADSQIFINGVLATPAATTRYSHNVLDVYVSILDTSADMYYDVQLVNTVSQISFPGLMNFVSTPEIAGTTACVKKQNVLGGSPSWKAFCLEGEVFSFTVVNLGGLGTPRVWFGPYECPGVRVHDDLRTVSCVVPADPDGTASVEQGLYLNYVDHNSSQVSFQLWDNPYAPRITALIGTDCYQSSNASMPMQCLFNPMLPGRNLSIVTSRLPALPPSQVWTVNMYFKQGSMMGAARFSNLHIDNPSQIIRASQPIATVWLDGNFRGALTDEAVYQVTLAANDLSDDDGSNILPLVLVSQITYDPVETSHSNDTWKIVVGVMLPLIFVAIVLGAYLYRRRQASKGGDIMSNNYVDSSSSRQMEMA